MNFYIAPLKSITSNIYRQVHARHFVGATSYYAPFISPTKDRIITPQQVGQIGLEHNKGLTVVPQVLVKNVDNFIWSVNALHNMGHSHVNLNLGCPAATVVTKGKGSAMLCDLDNLDRFLDTGYNAFANSAVKVSIKTRLGKENPDEFYTILEVFNKYPIHQLVVHPRVQKDFYKNSVRLPQFEYAVEHSTNPICYNGDIVSVKSYNEISRQFHTLQHVMIGRGIIADPSLIEKITGINHGADKQRLYAFMNDLFESYSIAYQSEKNALLRMREVLAFHIHLFQDSEYNYHHKFCRMRTVQQYQQLVDHLYTHGQLRTSTLPHWKT